VCSKAKKRKNTSLDFEKQRKNIKQSKSINV